MNHDADLDRTLTDWIDEGADQAPERFVWAALNRVERTAQRGAWRASTEEYLMQLKRAGPILGIAAVVVLAIVALQFVVTPNVGNPEATPRAYTPEDLAEIVLTEENAPSEMTVENHGRTTGLPALVQPLRAGSVIDTDRFVDALAVELHSAEGGFTSWSALFETAEEAESAFDFIATVHDSPEGWALADSRTDPGFGDESAMWAGRQYDLSDAKTILWRRDNLLLAMVGWGGAEEDDVRTLADGMDDRAN